MYHLFLGIEQAIVHIDIKQLGTILNLMAGDGECLVIFLFIDEAEELARTGYIASLTYVDEVALGSDLAQLEAREPQGIGTLGGHMGLGSFDKSSILGNVGIGSAAAATNDIYQALIDVFLDLHGHIGRRLIVATEAIGQAGIGVARYIIGSACGECLEVGFHLCGTERAVESHGEDIGMAHRGEEGIECLS